MDLFANLDRTEYKNKLIELLEEENKTLKEENKKLKAAIRRLLFNTKLS